MTTSDGSQLLAVFPAGPDGNALDIAESLLDQLHLSVVDIGLDPITECVEVRMIASSATEDRLLTHCLERGIEIRTEWISG
jgi:hypothetical protein